MLQDIDLRELSEMRSSGRDYVSVYFRVKEGLDRFKSRRRNLEAMLEEEPDEAEHFRLSMEMIEQLIADHPVDAEAACVFACGVLDFVRGHPLSMDVEPCLHVGPSPYIRPLAELQDEYQTFAVVACSNDASRILLVTNEQSQQQQQVKGGVKNHVRKGGWSQQRYERRRDRQLHEYAQEVAEQLHDLCRKRKIQRVVLIGSEETMNHIEEELDDAVAEKLIATERFDLKRSEDELIAEAYSLYFQEEREEEQSLWEKIRNEYKRHGLAVAGPTHVLEALQQGRAAHVIVMRDAKLEGTQCRECGHLVHGTPDTCQQCGSASVFTLDLVDAITKQAELTSAAVEYSDEIQGLQKVNQVAALLRF